MQPIYRTNPFVTAEGNGRGRTNAYIKGSGIDVGADVFRRGLCLPSDNKMTPEQQNVIIEILHRCFRWCRLDVHESVNRSTWEICRVGRACMRSVDKEMPYLLSINSGRRYVSAGYAWGSHIVSAAYALGNHMYICCIWLGYSQQTTQTRRKKLSIMYLDYCKSPGGITR